MSLVYAWKSSAINISASNTLTAETDLTRPFDLMAIDMPALTSTNLYVQGAQNAAGVFKRLGGDNNYLACAAANYMEVVKIYGFQYIKLECATAQAANVTFKVRGIAL